MESSPGLSEGQDVLSSPELAPSTATPAQAEAVQSEVERNLTQSEVNEIVKKVKRDERRKHEQQLHQMQMNAVPPAPVAPTPNTVSQPASPEDRIRQIVAEETKQQRETWEAQKAQEMQNEQAQTIVDKFYSKISAGKGKYQDFDAVTGDIELNQFTNTVQLLADHVENAADVLYEFGKDRLKMSQLEVLAIQSPSSAIVQIKRLADSIKENESAANVRVPGEPLSQLKHSNAGTTSGVMTMKELRAKYANPDWG